MPRPLSRIERRERQKLLRQTLMFGGVAIIICVLFIFLVLPNFIRILNAVVGGNTTVATEDRLPPQIPILAAPPSAVSEEQLSISGYAEPASTVVFLLNSVEAERQTIGDSGEFEVILSLTEGENTITAYAVSSTGLESNTGRLYTVVLDTQVPDLVLDDLEDGKTITGRTNQQLTIRGVTEPHARVFLNGRMVLANAEGIFQTSYFLNEGDNKLGFRAEDQAGNTTEQELKIVFRL